ncbi:ribonuclease H family protein [Brevibacterium moorei]|uniref:ribonuclease H family protein n=1 Tax=Brevibacterium moorei TaxID=2968457 RepID=UPI00211BF945|nr:ribonuclease HI [Brevibacterium sp. 68QC2CO]
MLTVAVDGSALGNPGPAGWAWYIDADNWAAGGWPKATNNRGELQAVIEVLEATADTGEDLHLMADSQYVINSVTKWMAGWKREGWKKRDGQEVVNKDQMVRIDELMSAAKSAGRTVDFEWVKGHAGHPLNEAADDAARGAAEAYRNKRAPDAGPGLAGAQAGRPRPAEARPDPVDDSVIVSCRLPRERADEVIRRARAAGVNPQEELAELIELGMERRYSL